MDNRDIRTSNHRKKGSFKYKEACRLHDAGEFKAAIALYNECPKTLWPQVRTALCYIKLDELDRGLNLLEALPQQCENNKDLFLIYRELISVYSFMYKKTRDVSYLEKQKAAIDNHPDQSHSDVMTGQAYYYYYMNQITESKAVIHEIANKFSDNPKVMNRIRLLLAAINKKEKKKLTEVQVDDLLRDAQKATSSNLSALVVVSEAHPEKIDLEVTPIVSTRSIEDRIKEALMYEHMEKLDIALKKFKQAIQDFPQNWKARRMCGHLLGKIMGRHQEAIDILLPVIKAIPPAPNRDLLKAYISLTISAFEVNDIVNAREYAKAGLKIEPSNAILLSQQGKLCDNRDGKKSRFFFDHARKSNPDRFNHNHPAPASMAPKVKIDNRPHPIKPDTKDVVKKIEPLNTLQPRPVIGGNKVVPNQKPIHIKPRDVSVYSHAKKPTVMTQPAAYYEKMIDYSNVSKKSKTPLKTAQTKISLKEPNKLNQKNVSKESKPLPAKSKTVANDGKDRNIGKKPAVKPNCSKQANMSVSVSPSKSTQNNLPQVKTNYCNRFLLFTAAVTTLVVAPALLAITSLNRNSPGNGSGS